MAGRRVFFRSRFIFYFSVFSVFCIPFVCYFNCVCDCGVYQARIKLKRTRFCQSRLPYYSNSVSSFNVPALQILRSNDVSPQPGPFCNDSISVYYQNVRSLKAFSTNDDGLRECKLSVLKDIVYGSDFDLVALTETWLNSAVTDLEILPHYNIFRKDRTGRPGGGVLLAVKDRITVKNTLSLPGETIAVEIILRNNELALVAVCYRAPDDQKFLPHFKSVLDTACQSKYSSTLILGDFNFPSIQWIDGSGFVNSDCGFDHDFTNMLADAFLYQVIDLPTRKENILDLVLSSNPDNIVNISVDSTFGLPSDHYCVYLFN